MPMISQKDQDTLKDKFAKDLTGDVTLTLFTQQDSQASAPGQECMYCKETRELLEELTALSPKLKLQVYDLATNAQQAKDSDVDKVPAIVLSNGTHKGVRYFGIPSGYEFASLIEDIVDVSRDDTDLSPDVKTVLNGIDQDVHIQVFVTPT